jgi:hypothetical protein
VATGTTSDQYPPLVSPDDGGGEGMAASASSEAYGAHGVSAQLERILAEDSSPRARRLLRAARVELRLLVALAAPAVAVYMIPVHEDLLRAARYARARRRFARQRRYPGLCVRPHGTCMRGVSFIYRCKLTDDENRSCSRFCIVYQARYCSFIFIQPLLSNSSRSIFILKKE